MKCNCCCCLFFTFLWIIVIASVSGDEETNFDYINRQLNELKVDVAKSYSDDIPLAADRVYDVRWQPLWEKDVNSYNALAISYSNETFVLADEKVLHVGLDVAEKVTLHQVAFIKDQKSAKFVRTIFWKASLFFLICRDDGSCTLHVGPTTNDLRYSQIINRTGIVTDAEFFTQLNQLYLVLANKNGQFSVPSVIYRWTGTYMDIISEISTTGAVSVVTFNHKHSTIIIFAQNIIDRPNIGTEIFKFDNGVVEKIQFLNTDGPIYVHHYEYEDKTFLLVVNEMKDSQVFWWDGKEFLEWMKLPEITSPKKVNVVYVDGDTLLLVAKKNVLSLYRIMNLAYLRLNLLELKNETIITDFNARVNGNSIILVLVTKSADNKPCHVEPMELTVKKYATEDRPEKIDDTWQSLMELERLLNDRMPLIEKAYELWPKLLPFSENVFLSSSEAVDFENVVIDSGSITNLVVLSSQEILTPTKLASGLEQISLATDSLILESNDLFYPEKVANVTGKLIVRGDAFVDELHLDFLNVENLNNKNIELEKVFSYTKDQKFADPLRGDFITIENLAVDSLCGIPFENWQIKTDKDKTGIDLFADNVEIFNNTILVKSDISVSNLAVSYLNHLHLKTFVNDLFIVGFNQEINGNLFYKYGLNVYDLRINSSNGIKADQLLTKTTDQILINDFFIKNLKIGDIYVDKINNVHVNEAVKISEKNWISGQITFHRLKITEELIADDVPVNFDLRPIQIYDTVQIYGDVVLKNLEIGPGGSIYVNDSEVRLNSLFDDYWTKSTDQNITKDVTLSRGITIDDLYAEYLNGYKDEDFLLSTVEEISDKFGNFYFKRFEIDGYLIADGVDESSIDSVVTNDNEDLIINQKIRITDFKVINLNAETYNKIPVNEIANGSKIGTKIYGLTKYENLIIKENFTVDELKVEFLNKRNMNNFFEEALVVDENLTIDYLEIENLQTENFQVEKLNGLNMADFYRMLIYKDVKSVKNLTVDGDLLINGDLKVEYINDLKSSNFLQILSNSDIELTAGDEKFDKFVVRGNLTTDYYTNGIKIEDLFSNTLSKSKNQRITGKYSFYKVQTDSLKVNSINGYNVTYPKLVTDPLFIDNDVIFSMLLVQGDILTGYLNDRDINEIYDNALNVPLTHVSNFTITGDISWEKPGSLNYLSNCCSISNLIGNAVTKNTNQTIFGETTFVKDVYVNRLTRISANTIAGVDITSIVSDAVLEIGKTIVLRGKKSFKKGLKVGKLSVYGDTDIRIINDFDIVDLNSTIVRKYDDRIINADTIFKNNVTVVKLEVGGKIHGIKSRDIADYNWNLPNNLIFENLVIENELNAKKLDGIDFYEFMENRVTINGDEESVIINDVVFEDLVVVDQNAEISTINGIEVDDVVINDSEIPQIITSEKIVLNDFSVNGEVFVDLINDTDLTREYENGLLNNGDIRIDGNLIFAANFETDSNVKLSGLVNGVDLSEFSQDLTTEDIKMMKNFDINQIYVDKMIEKSFNYSKNLPQLFFYFDEEPELVIRVPNIRKVETLNVEESMTKLNLYGFENGSNCNLPDFCKCRTQYVAELLENECKLWKVNGTNITYNIHDTENRYGVNVVTDTTSNKLICTKDNYETEFTRISWIIPRKTSRGQIMGEFTNTSFQISGYLSDVKTFTIGVKLYVVLAIYYDASYKSHRVNSLIYEIDLINGDTKLSQKIVTSGAVAMDVFATKLHGMHLIIACEIDPAESQLHRFNIKTSQFELLRSFRTGGSTCVKSIVQNDEYFVILDDPLANSVHIFNYNKEFDNYHFYQSLYHSSAVKDIQVFYSGEFGVSDAFVIVTTDEGRFYVYEYMFFGGFQLRSQEWLDGVQTMVPFRFSQRRYIFAGTNANSTIYRIVEQGPNYNL